MNTEWRAARRVREGEESEGGRGDGRVTERRREMG